MTPRRLYFDHAATSWPKADVILDEMDRFARNCGAAAGRGAYRSANEAGAVIADVRRRIAARIGAPSARCVSLHASGTAALNAAIHGLVEPGDHVVTTAAEHNSVLRPLESLRQYRDVRVTVVPCNSRGLVSIEDVADAVTDQTRLVAVTHASNVTGVIQPVDEIARRLSGHPTRVLCDAAQTFGMIPIDVAETGLDLLAAPGHKGGDGPMGTGFLYASPDCQDAIDPIIQGGTGTSSESLQMPSGYPEKLEAGISNVPALAGWAAGLRHAAPVHQRADKCLSVARQLYEGLASISGLSIFGTPDGLPIVSVVTDNLSAGDLASILDIEYGIETRAGLHCAAFLHEFMGTAREGTLRVSASPNTTGDEISAVVDALASIVAKVTC